MNKLSKTAGILSIISGLFGILWGILLLANTNHAHWWAVVLAGGIIQLILGLLCLISGLLARKQKAWGFALTGGILGIFTFFPTAIAAIILLFLGKGEFKRA